MPDWQVEPKILLSHPVPAPLHGTAPRVVLGNRWWGKVKMKAYKSTEFHCKACGVHRNEAKSRKWLEAHECYEIDYINAKMIYQRTVPLCTYCHNYVHRSRLEMLLAKGKIHQSKYTAIVQHGDRVLADAGMVRPTVDQMHQKILELFQINHVTILPEWGDWRLVVDGKEYEPKYKSREQWLAVFGEGTKK